MKVLDLGAADGGCAFQAERLGAASVLATDSYLWGDAPGTSRAAFDCAREALGSKVEGRYLAVLDHSPETAGVFDLVLFLGVLYHMRHPLLALERLFSVTVGQAIVESHVDLLDHDRPAMAFYPTNELNGDPSNWWRAQCPRRRGDAGQCRVPEGPEDLGDALRGDESRARGVRVGTGQDRLVGQAAGTRGSGTRGGSPPNRNGPALSSVNHTIGV